MTVRANFRIFLCVIAVLSVTTSSSWAQSAAPTRPETPSTNAALGEVIVTARRREESAQTVPVSVSVISADALVTKGIETTNDLQRLVPGVILNGAGSQSNTTYTIRGQGKSVTGPGLPSVITYVNEVPLPSIGSFTPTFDLDNVQILKGPQGTLFGRNTTGGAVLVYSKAPTYDLGGYIQADIGNYNERSFQGAINAPIVDNVLAIRLAGSIERRDGYTKNVSTGQRQDDKHMDAFRVSVLFQPTDRIKNVLVYDYMKSDTNSLGFYPFQPLTPQVMAAAQALRQTHGDRAVESSIRPFDKSTFWGITNTTTVDSDIVTFKNIFGYRYTDEHNVQNATGLADSPLPNLGPALSALGYVPGELGTLITTHNRSITRQYSDEVQFAGTALNDAIKWLVGGFWLDEGPAGQDYLTLDIFRPTSPSPTLVANINNFLGGIWPIGSQVNTLYGDKSKAVFGSFSLDLGKFMPVDGLTLNAGYRYTWDDESVCSNGSTSTTLATGESLFTPFSGFKECRAFTGNALSPTPSFDGRGKFSAPTYTLGLDYKLNDDVFFYFTTRRGYRAGGLNSPTMAPALSAYQTFAPQKVTDYEVGTHTRWESGTWSGRFNVAAFTSKFTGLQLQATGITANSGIPGVNASNAPSNLSLTINAGSARAQGVEVDGVISPFRSLRFDFSGAYLTQKYLKQQPPAILAPFFQAGKGFTGVPKWSYQAAVDYDLPLDSAIGTITLHADHYYLAEEFQGPVLLPAYNLTGFSVIWSNVFRHPLSATLYVDNAFDKKYVQDVILSTPSFGTYTGNFAPPRMYGVRLRYDFGS